MNFTKSLSSSVILFIAAAIQTAPVLADGPSHVRIDSITYAGSGCPAGSLAESLSVDSRLLSIEFDSYIAEIGPGVSRMESRKNCQINVSLSYPQGWSFAVNEVDYRGYISLERGVTGVQSTTQYFAGRADSVKLQTTFRGPMDTDYQLRDQLGISSILWSPCGVNRSLNLSTQIRLDNSGNRNGSGLMTLDQISTRASHRYGLIWKRC